MKFLNCITVAGLFFGSSILAQTKSGCVSELGNAITCTMTSITRLDMNEAHGSIGMTIQGDVNANYTFSEMIKRSDCMRLALLAMSDSDKFSFMISTKKGTVEVSACYLIKKRNLDIIYLDLLQNRINYFLTY